MSKNALHVDPNNSKVWSLVLDLRGVRAADPTEVPPRVVATSIQPRRVVPRARGFRAARVARRVEPSGDGDDPPPHRARPPRRLPSPAHATRRQP